MNKKIFTKFEDGKQYYAVESDNISCTCAHCDTYQTCSDGDRYITTDNLDLAKIINGFVSCSKNYELSFLYNGEQYDCIEDDKVADILPFYDTDNGYVGTQFELEDDWRLLEF